MKNYYMAGFVPEEGGGYSVYFPDLPMVVAEGDSMEEALENASIQMIDALIYMAANNQEIPAPSTLSDARRKVRDLRVEAELPFPAEGVEYQLFKIPSLDNTPVRLNISLPKSVVAEIDEKAKHYGMTRSGFIAKAAQHYQG